MTVSGIAHGDVLITNIARITASEQRGTARGADVSVLDKALDLQEAIPNQLLQALGIGQHVDVEV